jgi:hypothetical protein
VPESVIAAVRLLGQKSVDEIVVRVSPAELEVVGAYAAIANKRNLA